MVRITEFFYQRFAGAGDIVLGVIFFVLAVFGIVVAVNGKRIMAVLVRVAGAAVGILSGAMAGLLLFDSFILMIVFAVIGGFLIALLLRYAKGVVYFIGMGALGFFLAFAVTSEMYTSNTQMTESSLLLIDLMIAFAMGILSLFKSKYIMAFITAPAGGVMTSVGIFGLFGYYFSDWKTQLTTIVVSLAGICVQLFGNKIFGKA